MIKACHWTDFFVPSEKEIQNQKQRKTMTAIQSNKSKLFSLASERIRRFAIIVAFTVVAATTGEPAETKADGPAGHQLIGTWKLISAKYGGQPSDISDQSTTLKHVTPSQFMWASYDKDGTVARAAGGSYTIKGEIYEETPEYGLSSDFDLIKGKLQTFKWKVEGNKWYHNGKLSNGLTIEEVWERVEKK
jgi:hypothetical protein